MKQLSLAFSLLLILFLGTGLAQANCKAGDRAQVLWKGTWYKASVLKSNGSKCYIHYDGYNNSWDEWVGPARIKVKVSHDDNTLNMSGSRYHVGDAVQVKWKGKWWSAHVLRTKGNTLYIHYDGYNSSWDEWVGPGRYR